MESKPRLFSSHFHSGVIWLNCFPVSTSWTPTKWTNKAESKKRVSFLPLPSHPSCTRAGENLRSLTSPLPLSAPNGRETTLILALLSLSALLSISPVWGPLPATGVRAKDVETVGNEGRSGVPGETLPAGSLLPGARSRSPPNAEARGWWPASGGAWGGRAGERDLPVERQPSPGERVEGLLRAPAPRPRRGRGRGPAYPRRRRRRRRGPAAAAEEREVRLVAWRRCGPGARFSEVQSRRPTPPTSRPGRAESTPALPSGRRPGSPCFLKLHLNRNQFSFSKTFPKNFRNASAGFFL